MAIDDREAYLGRIAELFEQGAFRQALRACDEALASFPDCAEAHDYRGLVLSRLGRHGEAVSAYDRALGIEPDFVPALLDKSELLVYSLGGNEDAIALTDRVLRLGAHPLDVAHALYLKGVAYANLELHEEALANYEASLALDPEYPDAQCERGASLYECYRFAEALRCLKAAAQLDPGYARPHHFLGCIYEYMGEEGLSAREFASAARLDEESYPQPLSLPEQDFERAVQEAVNTLPREVTRLLPAVDLTVRRLPDRALMADRRVRPSTLSLRGRRGSGGRLSLTLFQRNLERTARSRAELVKEIAHAIAHDLGHPESAA